MVYDLTAIDSPGGQNVGMQKWVASSGLLEAMISILPAMWVRGGMVLGLQRSGTPQAKFAATPG